MEPPAPASAQPTMPTVLALVFYLLHYNVARACGADRRRLYSRKRVAAPCDAECAICLAPYQHGSYQAHMHCGHFFHCRCLTRWQLRSHTCPMCRAATPSPSP